MRRFLLIIPLFFLLAVSFAVTTPIVAAPITHTWEFTTESGGDPDTTYGQSDWEVVLTRGTYTAETGFVGTNYASTDRGIHITFSFGEVVTVTELTVVYNRTCGTGPFSLSPVSSQAGRLQTVLEGTPSVHVAQGSCTSGSDLQHHFAGSVIADSIFTDVISDRDTPRTGSSLIKRVIATYEPLEDTGEIGRPFTSADEDDWGLSEYIRGESVLYPVGTDVTDTVVGFSAQKNLAVHAGFAGTVLSVAPLTEGSCNSTLETGGIFGGLCSFNVYEDVTGDSTPQTYTPGFYVYPGGDGNLIGIQKVVIESTSDPNMTLEYWVTDSGNYVAAGDQISEGCVIGNSLEFRGAIFELGLGGDIGIGGAEQRGLTVVKLYDENVQAELFDDLKTTFPTNNTPCNTPEEYSDCYGGSTLDHPENWNASDGASIDSPGATLGRFSNITYSSPFNLNSLRNPRMRVNARATGGAGSMVLTMGSTSETFDVGTSVYEDYLLSGETIEGDLPGGLYTIQIANNSDASISIRYICISHELDEEGGPEPDPPPPTCYFQNPSFVNGLTDWTADAGVTVGNSPGEIHVPSGDTFYQSVHLYPGDYTIRVRAGLRYYVAYSPDENEATDTLEIEYTYDALNETIDTATFGELAQGNNSFEFITTFNIASETTANFVFEPTLTTSEGSVVGAAVRDVCLYAGDDPDNPFPGHPDPTEPQPGIFTETCDPFTEPQGSAVHHWLAWHWYKLNQFFQCDLMVLLNRIFDVINRFFQMVGWVMRWMMLNIQLSIDWVADQVLPWLGGYLANAGTVGSVADENTSPGSGCSAWDLLCHLRHAIEDVIGGLFDFLGDVWSQVLTVLGAIANFLGQIIEKLVELISKTVGLIISVAVEVMKFVFNLAVDLATSIINAVVYILTQIVNMLMFIRDLIVSLVVAWNDSEPIEIEVLTCEGNAITSSLCWIWWLANNTILAGTLGGVIVPLITAIVFILLAIKFAADMRRVFIDTAAQTA